MSLFPYKLHQLLTDIHDNYHLSSIICWLPSGKAFQLHEPELFESILLNKYFPRQTQLKSFKRQLQYYGFDNLGDGVFAHPKFLKDKRHLCGQIIHQLPTKSQKVGNALDHKKVPRGKRAKKALRKSLLTESVASSRSAPVLSPPQAAQSAPVPSPQMAPQLFPPMPSAAFPLGFNRSVVPHHQPIITNKVPMRSGGATLKNVLQKNHDTPNQYWCRLNKKNKKSNKRRIAESSIEKGGICPSLTSALIHKSQNHGLLHSLSSAQEVKCSLQAAAMLRAAQQMRLAAPYARPPMLQHIRPCPPSA